MTHSLHMVGPRWDSCDLPVSLLTSVDFFTASPICLVFESSSQSPSHFKMTSDDQFFFDYVSTSLENSSFL